MGIYIEPTHAWMKGLNVAGADMLLSFQSIKVHETVCKPYRTACIVVRDSDNIIENLGIVGGEPVSFSFSAPPNGDTYDATMNIMALQGHADPENLKSIIYSIDVMDMTFFQDRSQVVQRGFKSTSVSDAISQVHGDYLNSIGLEIRSSATNRFDEAYDISNKKPFTAIYDLAKQLSGGSYKNGNALYYRDRYTNVLASLEDLLSQMGRQEFFIQKETWGINFFDPQIYQAIIYAEARSNKSPSGGRGDVSEIAAAMSQGRQVFDYATANITFQGAQSFGAGVSSIGGSTGGLGGSPNVQTTNSKQHPDANAPWRKTAEERAFSASSRGGPQIEVQVPLQTGINVTVGKGFEVQLLPSGGGNPFRNSASGLYLATDLVHVLEGDNEQSKGTTTIQGLKPG
jgi:hypothetical protein